MRSTVEVRRARLQYTMLRRITPARRASVSRSTLPYSRQPGNYTPRSFRNAGYSFVAVRILKGSGSSQIRCRTERCTSGFQVCERDKPRTGNGQKSNRGSFRLAVRVVRMTACGGVRNLVVPGGWSALRARRAADAQRQPRIPRSPTPSAMGPQGARFGMTARSCGGCVGGRPCGSLPSKLSVSDSQGRRPPRSPYPRCPRTRPGPHHNLPVLPSCGPDGAPVTNVPGPNGKPGSRLGREP
jgi:hypothetical protein